jgi:hypothetical protein
VLIPKNKYQLHNRNLNFDVVDDFDFNSHSACYYFRGGNGFGKTSFLEKIVIPALEAANCQYLYIGQDIRTQLYTLRALLSVQGHRVSETDEYDLLRLWVQQGQSARIFILDEFDKYFPDYSFIFDWSKSFIQSYIIVTHQQLPPIGAAARSFASVHVRFELIDVDGHVKNVRVRKE